MNNPFLFTIENINNDLDSLIEAKEKTKIKIQNTQSMINKLTSSMLNQSDLLYAIQFNINALTSFKKEEAII